MTTQMPNPLDDEPQTEDDARTNYRLELAAHAFNELTELGELIERAAVPAVNDLLKDYLRDLMVRARAAIEVELEYYGDGQPAFCYELEGNRRNEFLEHLAGWSQWVTGETADLLRRVREQVEGNPAEDGEAA
ncbi:hypothetical protein [Streptomyces sviceus]|uniref:hypothetical protein n=1 Tax=Streptomyces sviceus TaxID=285530 RepID=UPI0033165602